MIKNSIALLLLLILATKAIAQTNTFPDSGDVGVGTNSPETKLHVLNGTSIGIKTTYSDLLIENVDSHLDLVSSSLGTWGSAINFVEGNGTANTNVWSIARQTTNGDGNSGLLFNFGAKNQHNNTNIFTMLPTGDIGIGTTVPETKFHVQNGSSVGIKTTYSSLLLEAADSQLDILSNSGGDWGSAINLVEGMGSSNANVWSIARQTTNGSGDSGLRFNFGTNNHQTNINILTMLPNGSIGIGTTRPDSKLSVNGNIRAKEVKVETTNWPDYVFEGDYKLLPLVEVKKFIQKNGHLPSIPSAENIAQHGLNLGEMDAHLLQKIEELTLHIIQQNELITNQSNEIEGLQQQLIKLADLENRLLNLERESGDEIRPIQVNNTVNDQ